MSTVLAKRADPRVVLPGTTGNYLSVPDEAALDIAGDLDIRVKVSMDDWTPAAFKALVAKENESSQRSYWFGIPADGRPTLYWSTTGSDYPSAAAAVAPGFVDGTTHWLRVTLDVDNGSGGKTVTFYTSEDGTTWSMLGVPVTSAGTTSIFNGTAPLTIGAVYSSPTGGFLLAGKVWRAIVKNGIDGTTVLDADCSVLADVAQRSFAARTGQTVTINGAEATVERPVSWVEVY